MNLVLCCCFRGGQNEHELIQITHTHKHHGSNVYVPINVPLYTRTAKSTSLSSTIGRCAALTKMWCRAYFWLMYLSNLSCSQFSMNTLQFPLNSLQNSFVIHGKGQYYRNLPKIATSTVC